MNILTFGMAVNDRRRNTQTGEWEDYANFVDCVLFGNRAEFLSRTLHKGTKVVVEGKLRYSSWERDGQRRSKLEVVVDDVDFVSPRQQQGGYQPQQGGYASSQQNAAPSYSAPAPAAPQAQQQDDYAAQPQQSAQQPPAQPRQVVTAPPQADVYDADIPF
jgi:single-strand DNA-binding protein